MLGFWMPVSRRLVTVAAWWPAFLLAITVAGATAAAWLGPNGRSGGRVALLGCILA